jgi:hypothetical protein
VAGKNIYNPAVRKLNMKWTILQPLVLLAMLTGLMLAQEAPSAAAPQTPEAAKQPKFQVNFLNSCRPASAEAEEIGMALARVKDKPAFSADFEVSRGFTTLSEAEARATGVADGSGPVPSSWVRIRREFPDKALLTSAQYSLSLVGQTTSEVLALHLREGRSAETRDVLQILISDSVNGRPSEVVKVDTPPDRIRIERFGKPSIVLARCGGVDQSTYEPLFLAAARVLEKYRSAMAVKTVIPSEWAHLPVHKESKAAGANH